MRTIWFVSSAVLLAAVGAAAILLHRMPDADAQATVPVSIGDNWFCNASFAGGTCDTNVSVGDTVQWTSTGSNPHTVTECGDAFTPCPQPGGFDSGTLNNSQTFSQSFPTAGTYEYQCAIHGSAMQGRIVVAAQQATPSPGPSVTPAGGSPTAAAPTAAGAATATATGLPAAAPATGGEPSGAASSMWLLVALAGLIFITAGIAGVRFLRQR
jgi:plastocyanin